MFCLLVAKIYTKSDNNNICVKQISIHNIISELLVLALCMSSTIWAVVRWSCHLPANSSTHDLLAVAVDAVGFFLSTTKFITLPTVMVCYKGCVHAACGSLQFSLC